MLRDKIAVFEATLHMPHAKKKNMKRGHRLVVLPDYQGIGLGHNMSNFIANYFKEKGFDYYSVLSNPSLIHSRRQDSKWLLTRYGRKRLVGKTGRVHFNKTSSSRRITASFKWVG